MTPQEQIEARIPKRETRMGLMSVADILRCWPSVVEALSGIPRFFDYYTVESVLEAVTSQHMQFWVIGDEEIELLVATQVVIFPQIKVFQIIGASGAGFDSAFGKMYDVFNRVAAMYGCREIQVVGRFGWIRKLRGIGASHEYSVVAKAVTIEKES